MTLVRLAAFGLVLAVGSTSPAAAHHIWIDPDASGTVLVHFGEFAENLKEVSPGLLDRIELTGRLVSPGGEKSLEARKGTSGFSLSGRAAPGESIIVEDPRAPVRERRSGDQIMRSVYHPAARLVTDLAERNPVLTLDIVPTTHPGRFKVTFRGAPLPRARVKIIASSGWMREVRSDGEGMFEVAFPWKGVYVVDVSHSDPTPGSRDGEAFNVTNYVTTLSFAPTSGLEPLPLPSPATPNR
jgi:uncharacterized GH25 family protein